MDRERISVSEEYLESLCDWMLEWAAKEDSYTVPQFLQWKGMGYYYLKYFCQHSDIVYNTFEEMKSIIHNRWFNLAMNTDSLPPHKSKMLMRYLRYYDAHAFDLERQMKESVIDAHTREEMKKAAENYARKELQEPFEGIYQKNDNKRRSGNKA